MMEILGVLIDLKGYSLLVPPQIKKIIENFETELRRAAMLELNPLCTLRYSATHRNPYNLLRYTREVVQVVNHVAGTHTMLVAQNYGFPNFANPK